MNLSDDQKKILLKLLKEGQHREAYDWPTGRPTCTCGYTCKTESGLDQHIKSHTRTFITWQDLGDCKDVLVKKGLWEEFECQCYPKWNLHPIPMIMSFANWLFHPTDENGEAHFCRLVAEFMESKL